MTLDTESLGAGGHVLTVGFGKITAGEAEIVNGIQQVRFAHAIRAAYADNAVSEAEPGVFIVLEVEK